MILKLQFRVTSKPLDVEEIIVPFIFGSVILGLVLLFGLIAISTEGSGSVTSLLIVRIQLLLFSPLINYNQISQQY